MSQIPETIVKRNLVEQESSPAFSLQSILEYGSRLLGLFVGVAGFAYTLGFIITNSSLLEYGLSTFELFQTRYIASGLLFMILILVFLAESLYDLTVLSRLRYLGEHISWVRVTRNAVVSWLWLVFMVLVFSMLMSIFPATGAVKPFGLANDQIAAQSLALASDRALDLFQRMLVWATMLFLAFKWSVYEIIGAAWIGTALRTGHRRLRSSVITFPAIIGFPLVVFIIVYYSIGVYPSIPQSFGGGAPLPAYLIVQEEEASVLRALGVGATPSTSMAANPGVKPAYTSQQVLLLDQSGETLLLAVPGSLGVLEAVSIDKGMVVGIKYPAPVSTAAMNPLNTSTPSH